MEQEGPGLSALRCCFAASPCSAWKVSTPEKACACFLLVMTWGRLATTRGESSGNFVLGEEKGRLPDTQQPEAVPRARRVLSRAHRQEVLEHVPGGHRHVLRPEVGLERLEPLGARPGRQASRVPLRQRSRDRNG